MFVFQNICLLEQGRLKKNPNKNNPPQTERLWVAGRPYAFFVRHCNMHAGVKQKNRLDNITVLRRYINPD